MDNAAAGLEAQMDNAAKAAKVKNRLVNEIVFIMVESTFSIRTERKPTVYDRLEGILKEVLERKGIPIDTIKNEVIEEYRVNIDKTSKRFSTMLEFDNSIIGINPIIGGVPFNVAIYTNHDILAGSGYKSLRDALNALSPEELAELQKRLHNAKHPFWTSLLRGDKWLV